MSNIHKLVLRIQNSLKMKKIYKRKDYEVLNPLYKKEFNDKTYNEEEKILNDLYINIKKDLINKGVNENLLKLDEIIKKMEIIYKNKDILNEDNFKILKDNINIVNKTYKTIVYISKLMNNNDEKNKSEDESIRNILDDINKDLDIMIDNELDYILSSEYKDCEDYIFARKKKK